MIAGASPSEGSSMIRSAGFVSSARAIASICCSPPESCAPRCALRSLQPGKELVRAFDRPRFEPPRALIIRRCFVDRERGEEPSALRDVADA